MLELKIGGGHDEMGVLEFIASIIGSVAWPIAAVIIALAFRKQIAGLLNKIRRFSWGDTSVELAEQLDKVETASQSIPVSDYNPGPPDPTDRFQSLLDISPSAAILDSWTAVERLLRDIGKQHNYDPGIATIPIQIARQLHRDKLISDSIFEMVRDLRGIRNAAAHERDVNPSDAYRFKELADKVTHALARLAL